MIVRVASVGAVVGDELRHDGEGLRRVHAESGARAVEALVAHPEGVVVCCLVV